MESNRAKTTGALLGAVMLAGSGLAAAAPLAASAQTADAPVAASEACETARQCALTTAKSVVGSFAFSQAAETPASDISDVFRKAASALCASLPVYGETAAAEGIALFSNGASVGAFLTGDNAEAESMLMACSCSTNAAGGGAIVNATASGTSVKTLSWMLG